MLAASESNLPQPQHFLTPKSLVYVINSKLCCRGFVPKFKRRQEKLDRLKGRMCDEKLKHSYFQSFKKADCFFLRLLRFLSSFVYFFPLAFAEKKVLFLTPDFIPIFFSNSLQFSFILKKTHSSLSLCVHACVGVCTCVLACV